MSFLLPRSTDLLSSSQLSTTNQTFLAIYYQTHAIPQRFNPGIIVASILVSVLGSYTTLLLLGRRTSNKGRRNFGLLLMAAATMSSVGIWGMHFVGMHMTLAPSEGVNWYVQFSPGFTAMSLFVPLFALSCAFLFLGSQSHLKIGRAIITGILFGCIVSLMHFSASFSASFQAKYKLAQLILSIALACVAGSVALVIFFRWRSQWQDVWWKRGLCAIVLGCAVSGMHYLALSGTSWFVRPGETTGFTQGKKTSTTLVIAISVMCFVLCLISVGITWMDHSVTQENRRNAKQVVVACAAFDAQGRLLVRNDGLMPMVVIESRSKLEDILHQLHYRQPTFQWIYRLSFDWSILDPFLSKIIAYSLGLLAPGSPKSNTTSVTIKIANADVKNTNEESTANPPVEFDARSMMPTTPQTFSPRNFPMVPASNTGGAFGGPNYSSGMLGRESSLIFRQRFIESAAALSQELRIPLKEIGVLYDRLLLTGTRKPSSEGDSAEHGIEGQDLEKGFQQHARDDASIHLKMSQGKEGVMLFLVRQVKGKGSDNVDEYSKRGYRMTETRFISSVLADRFGVEKSELEGFLNNLECYAKRGTKPVVQPGGIYIGLFGVRPNERRGTVDTLVYNFARHQIPAYRLPGVTKMSPETREYLASLMGMNMIAVGAECEKAHNTAGMALDGIQTELAIFKNSLLCAMEALVDSLLDVYPYLGRIARLSTEILETPSSSDDSTKPAQIILFEVVLPAEDQEETEVLSSTPFIFTPYSLFSKAQAMILRSKSARDFSKSVRLELAEKYGEITKICENDFESERTYARPLSSLSTTRDENAADETLVTPFSAASDISPRSKSSGFGIFKKNFSAQDVQLLSSKRGSDNSSGTPSSDHSLFYHGSAGSRNGSLPAYQAVDDSVYQKDAIPLKETPSPPKPTLAKSLNSYTIAPSPSRILVPQHGPSDIAMASLSNNNFPSDLGTPFSLKSSKAQTPGKRPSSSNSVKSRDTNTISSEGHNSLTAPVLPLAVQARMRSDDWYGRCMSSLDNGPASEALKGFEW